MGPIGCPETSVTQRCVTSQNSEVTYTVRYFRTILFVCIFLFFIGLLYANPCYRCGVLCNKVLYVTEPRYTSFQLGSSQLHHRPKWVCLGPTSFYGNIKVFTLISSYHFCWSWQGECYFRTRMRWLTPFPHSCNPCFALCHFRSYPDFLPGLALHTVTSADSRNQWQSNAIRLYKPWASIALSEPGGLCLVQQWFMYFPN
jgi:hypothetical protein